MVTLSIQRVDLYNGNANRNVNVAETSYRGIVFTTDNMIADVAEHTNANTMLDYLFHAHDISAVRMPDGSLSAGDQLSNREVADTVAIYLAQ